MKGYAQEHLETVANRYRQLFKMNENEFRAKMFFLGWTMGEINQMVKYLERGK